MTDAELKRIETLGRFSLSGQRLVAWMAIGTASLAIVFAILDAVSKLTYHDPTCPDCVRDPSGDYLMLVVGGLGLVAGVVTWWWARDGKHHATYRLLRDRASEVVWVTRTTVLGTGRDRIVFHLESGRRGGELLCPTGSGPELMVDLQRALPHATFGLSEEIAIRFASDPRSLRRV